MVIERAGADSFPKLLLQHAQERPDKPAIREKNRGIWRTLTWRQLSDEAAALAAALSARGLKRGGYAALIGDNRPRFYAAIAAIQSLGAIAVPLYQDASAEELVAPLRNAAVTHVFAENQEQVDKILKILPQCPDIGCIVYDKDRGMRHYRQPQLVSYADLIKEGSAHGADKNWFAKEVASVSSGDLAFLFLTSGATGEVKSAAFTHGALIDRAHVVAKADQLSDSDVAMAYLSPGWIGQNLFGYVQPMLVGYCVCCPESSDTMLADMREIGPTYFLATPRVLDTLLTQVSLRAEDAGGLNLALYRMCTKSTQRIAAGKPASLKDRLILLLGGVLIYGPMRDVLGMSRIRVAYAAGDAIGPEILTYFRGLGVNLKQLYGSTETGFIVASQRDGNVKPGTVGTVVDGVELKFTPEREILVRSPGLFKEYHGDAAGTKRAVSDGWFHTGDVGYLGEDGELRIVERAANIGALKDGTQFAPRTIENKLKFSQYIREAIVFGAGRDKVCALIDIDFAAASRWADLQSITYTGHADLASREETYDLISQTIAGINDELASDPALSGLQVQRFAIVRKELNANDGLLTRTGKLRRMAIEDRYRTLIDGMFSGRTEVPAEGESDHTISQNMKIGEAKLGHASNARKAA